MSQAEYALPSYTHIPGFTPHPIGDPRGHSYGATPVPCSNVTWLGLPELPAFESGRRRFNHGYYWEAHETWEAVWIGAGRRGFVADFVKGLIKLAAAGVKVREASPTGALRHLARAVELFELTRLRANDAGASDGTGISNLLVQATALAARLQEQLPPSPAADGGKPLNLLGSL